MKQLRIPRWIIVLILTIFLGVFVVVFCFFQLRVTDKSLSPQLQIGDRVLVNKLSFPQRGDIVAYKNPFLPIGANYCLGRCLAMPGDTLRLFMEDRVCDSLPRQYSWQSVIIPRRNEEIEITPWNIELLSNALFTYERANVCPQCDTILIVNGVPQRKVVFSHDFVWISARGDSLVSDSRLFGFLSTDEISGTVPLISYSIGKDMSFPLDRIFKFIKK